MKIIVVGDGKVGFAIAKQLNQEGHDITVVENKSSVLSSTMNQLDIVGVQGNGASLDTLMEARVSSSDLLIAATSMDEVNIICCLLAKKLGARHTIARIRTDYVHEQQARYRTAIADLEQRIANASAGERVKLNKKLTTLQAQDTEIRTYEEKIHHLADQMISIDLDDGVKKNYAIFQDVLAKIK